MLNWWLSLKQRKERSKKKLKPLELRILNWETKSERFPNRPRARRKKPNKSTKKQPRNTLISSGNNLNYRKRISLSLRISTRRSRRSTNAKWRICKKNLLKKLRKWKLLKEEESLNLMGILLIFRQWEREFFITKSISLNLEKLLKMSKLKMVKNFLKWAISKMEMRKDKETSKIIWTTTFNIITKTEIKTTFNRTWWEMLMNNKMLIESQNNQRKSKIKKKVKMISDYCSLPK